MSEGYRFKEVRKGERGAIIAFAAEHGCTIAPETLRHHLSLAIESGGTLVAAALSTEQGSGQVIVQIVVGEASLDEMLLTELADRCLRKVQAQAITSARMQSEPKTPTETIWTRANWLDRIEEAPPAEPGSPADGDAQAA